MATIVRENISDLTDKITVKLSKEDYMPAFEKKVKEYSKQINIPGFRKGMVPMGVVKKMHGTGIFQDEILRSIDKEIVDYLEKEKPEIFAQPMPLQNDLSQWDFNNPGDIYYDFEIGLKPDFDLPALDAREFTNYKVDITDQMVNEEIDRMQLKAGQMTEPETADSEETVLNTLFTEVDADGNDAEGGIKKENSVLLKYLTSAAQKEFTGKGKGHSAVLALNEAFEGDKLDAIVSDLGLTKEDENKKFKISVDKLGLVEKATLDESFFQQVFPAAEIKTEEEFRTKLKEEIEKGWSAETRNQIHDQIFHYLVDNTPMNFPTDFLKRWMQFSGEKMKTSEEVEAEFPKFSNQLKWTLISDRIIDENKLEVAPEELKENMRNQVMQYFGQMNLGEDTEWLDSYIDRMMKDEKQVESAYRRLIAEKLFGHLEGQVKTTDKSVSADEFTQMVQNHHH